MAELYVGTRDGYIAGRVATGAAKPRGVYRAPDYTQPERGAAPRRGLASLVADFGGNVERVPV